MKRTAQLLEQIDLVVWCGSAYSLALTHATSILLTTIASLGSGWTTAPTPASETASPPSEASSVAHTSAEHAHKLGEQSTWVAPAARVSSAHSSDVLTLGFDCELTSSEERLVEVLGLERTLLVGEFDVCLPGNKKY